jgi:tetratricopeptide (TPR) repeat protein
MHMGAWRALAALLLALAAASTAAQGESPQQLFERAMRERERGDLYDAIRSFEAILAEHPGLNRARLELAVAYYHALNPAAALEQARRVLADPATPPAVRANVERLIAQIEREARPHSFAGYVSAGFLHDTNVSAGPSGPTYSTGGGLISLDPNAVKQADNALTLAIGGSHRYLSGMRAGVGGREGALLWQSQAALSRTGYRNEGDYDLQVLSVSSGPAWISPPRLRVSAPLQYDRLDLGADHYLDIVGVAPAVVFGGPSGLELQGDAQLQRRDYRRALDAGRDSRYRSVGLQGGRVIAGLTVQAGARLNRDDADAGRWDYEGSEWFALAASQLGARTSGYVRLTYLRNGYDEPDPVAAIGRTDRETRLAAGISHRLGDERWYVSAALVDIHHRSSVAFYAFKRRQLSLTLTRTF